MVRFPATLLACAAADEYSEDALSLLQLNAHSKVVRVGLNRSEPQPFYGNEKCQCISIDHLDGTTEVSAGQYPADLGARCEAWDDNRAEDCAGDEKEDWCADRWCYVDPCKCDIEVIPKTSAYLPDAKYQGKPVYYSYATCGSVDQWTEENHDESCVNLESEDDCKGNSKCAWSAEMEKCGGKEAMGQCDQELKEDEWGKPECRCVGIAGQDGTTTMTIEQSQPGWVEKYADYPAEVGSTCKAWESDNHPDCAGKDAPDWCSQKWCYVDPCSCDLEDAAPKQSFFLPTSMFQGRPLFYSYATCGGEDSFADKKVLDEALAKQAEVCGTGTDDN